MVLFLTNDKRQLDDNRSIIIGGFRGRLCMALEGVDSMCRIIKYLDEKDIVLFRTSGTYELEAEVETLKEIAAKLKKHNCNRFIVDHRETNVIADPVKSFERSALYEEIWGDRSTRAAIVFRELNEDYQFFETVVRNRGWNVRIFDDYDAAIGWLLE